MTIGQMNKSNNNRFWASGRPIILVCGDTFILCHFVYI